MLPDIEAALGSIATRRMRRRLVRCVPFLDFMASAKPTFLYTSGRPNRANPRGLDCLYFSESEATAIEEFREMWRGTPAERQPTLMFSARVWLHKIVDLGNSDVMRALALSPEDLYGDWRLLAAETRLQEIGGAISRQRGIAAIRFPSAAGHRVRRSGWNVAIFPTALKSPDRVEILGNSADPLEVLP